MEEIRVEIRFRYEGTVGYHYVVEKRKDAAACFTSAIKVAETYFRSCGWKKVELLSVGRLTNPNSSPETHVPQPPVPPAPKPAGKRSRTAGSASKAKPKPRTDTKNGTGTTRKRTKPAAKAEPAKRTRTSTRKPKR